MTSYESGNECSPTSDCENSDVLKDVYFVVPYVRKDCEMHATEANI